MPLIYVRWSDPLSLRSMDLWLDGFDLTLALEDLPDLPGLPELPPDFEATGSASHPAPDYGKLFWTQAVLEREREREREYNVPVSRLTCPTTFVSGYQRPSLTSWLQAPCTLQKLSRGAQQKGLQTRAAAGARRATCSRQTGRHLSRSSSCRSAGSRGRGQQPSPSAHWL